MSRFVTFASKEINVSVQCQLIGPAVIISHYPEGWQEVARPYRLGFPDWQGAQGYEVQIPIVLDGYRHRKSVNDALRKLERLTEPTRKFDPMRPPILRFDSAGDIPHDKTNSPQKTWVIAGTGLEYGDYFSQKTVTAASIPLLTGGAPITGAPPSPPSAPTPSGQLRLTRIFLTVHLWEYMAEEVVVVSLHNTPYKIQKGDTLQKIAREFYGDPSKWRAIAKKNNIRDPNHPRVGKTIKLP